MSFMEPCAFFIENGGFDTMISPKLLSKKSAAFGGDGTAVAFGGGGGGTVVAFGGVDRSGDGGIDGGRGGDGDGNANISPETSTGVF